LFCLPIFYKEFVLYVIMEYIPSMLFLSHRISGVYKFRWIIKRAGFTKIITPCRSARLRRHNDRYLLVYPRRPMHFLHSFPLTNHKSICFCNESLVLYKVQIIELCWVLFLVIEPFTENHLMNVTSKYIYKLPNTLITNVDDWY